MRIVRKAFLQYVPGKYILHHDYGTDVGHFTAVLVFSDGVIHRDGTKIDKLTDEQLQTLINNEGVTAFMVTPLLGRLGPIAIAGVALLAVLCSYMQMTQTPAFVATVFVTAGTLAINVAAPALLLMYFVCTFWILFVALDQTSHQQCQLKSVKSSNPYKGRYRRPHTCWHYTWGRGPWRSIQKQMFSHPDDEADNKVKVQDQLDQLREETGVTFVTNRPQFYGAGRCEK
eukprot:gene32774-58312_t